MSKAPKSGSETITLPGEAKQGEASGAPGRMAERDEKVVGSEGLTSDTSTDQSPEDLHKLGCSHLEQFQQLGTLSDLEDAIKYFSRAVSSTPDGDPDLSRQHDSLGLSYGSRYQRLGEPMDLEKSIGSFSRAFALTPDGHPDISLRHARLGMSYVNRYQRLGDFADLEKAIKFFSAALALTPDDHPDTSPWHAGLGASYGIRFQCMGELADLKKAIECDSQALALTPDDHPDMPLRYASLGASYNDRYRRLGDLSDLEKAIKYHSGALALTPSGHPYMAHRHVDLGVCYTDRYQRLGELADLEKAIECDSHALELTPDGHPDMASHYGSLGASYTDRYRRLGELADLEKAIECDSRAFALTPDGHPDMSPRHARLGISYINRYQRLDELVDLEKAIENQSSALKLTPDGHPDMSRRHASLGASFTHRYWRLGELADLEKSIESFSRALALTPDDHPDLASHHHACLGASCGVRYRRLGEPADLEKAIESVSRALALAPDGHPDLPTQHFNQGLNFLDQYQLTADPSHLHHSLGSFRKISQSLTGAPRLKFQYALRWADLASQHSYMVPMEAYQASIDLLPQFIWLGATTNQRYRDLSRAENLAVKACYAAIQSSNYSLALEWLEHARFDTLIVQAVPFNSTPEQAGKQRRHLASEYHSLLAQIRQLPGFENFLQPMKANELMRAVRSGPVVLINCHKHRCDALFIRPGYKEVTHLPLPDFTEDKARQAHFELVSSLKQVGLRQRGVRILPQPGYEDGIGGVLRVLWSAVVKPVLDYLGYVNDVPSGPLPHLTWCPTGPLSFLPLHAAGDYSQSQSKIFDYVISSYIPTISTLVTSTPSLLNRNCRVLAVGQATTPGRNPLPGAIKELAHIKLHTDNKAEYSQLMDSQATTTTVLDAMEHHDWVHLACHAHQNISDPTKSGFHLHDGTLDLTSINRRSFKNKGLAFLSACETATGDQELPDEAIHLASGMLMAGYPSVIATMWSVIDDDAPFVADKVYAQLMTDRKVGSGEAGKALHDAVAGLREKVGEKEFARWVPYIHMGS
ncbi:aromatic di-alanine and TPR containing protein [Rhizoctonia solani AG-3 Rhs1AP]|uniref:Aromatic di-alanine and TPR containing protein n=1 Tax=Rhizoctonia solani AG-3 Rhs1AP TaxID=1086054 RepID=X8J3R9_9AGAM|nr:aromatic di-alanine and TPR containing protein [Rhizoctonia solani AG-3 Rhs1AP]